MMSYDLDAVLSEWHQPFVIETETFLMSPSEVIDIDCLFPDVVSAKLALNPGASTVAVIRLP
ncbi:hypothetical protein ABIB87_005391 [Bradyrhizobium sp. JR18.2]